jgi:hypothetical protein
MVVFQASADQYKISILSLVNSKPTTGTGCKCADVPFMDINILENYSNTYHENLFQNIYALEHLDSMKKLKMIEQLHKEVVHGNEKRFTIYHSAD